ncbi:MAG: hypothetical protein ACWA5L_05730 [bacterium]
MFAMFPLLVISLVVYAVLNFTLPADWVQNVIITLPMVSGDKWTINYGDAFIIGSMGLLFVELLRATKTGTESILNHALSVVVFIVALLLFIIVKGFGNSTFFIFLTMTFLDFMAGFIVTTVTARRDIGVPTGTLG